MTGTEQRRRPTTAHVRLRDCDQDAVCLILAHMQDMGILIGKGSTSAAIRYALGWCADTISDYINGAMSDDDSRHRAAVALQRPPSRRGRRPDDHA